MRQYILLLTAVTCLSVSHAQRGKDLAGNVTATNTVVNAYTYLTADAAAGSSSITVNNNNLNSGAIFSSNLTQGDLLMIIQVQGATIEGMVHPTFGDVAMPDDSTWGRITNYNNCGNWEYAEVAGVSGGGTINLNCALTNDYTASGKVQVIRVPRFTSLDVSASGEITCPAWNGQTGGIVAIEVLNDANIDGSIDVSELGFRGGIRENNDDFSPWYTGNLPKHGGQKGEGIAGYQNELATYGGWYARAAPANGGGGGNTHNAGGGGGANAGVLPWTGFGNPDAITDPNWATAWNLEFAGFSTSTSGGGGRGGYSYAANNEDALVTGPFDPAWGGDQRKVHGGLGGRDLDYSTGRIFMAGGGGAGAENNAEGGSGGNAAGIVHMKVFGNITGSGVILANGADGENSEGPAPGFGQSTGRDGSGGAGSGGTVIADVNGTIGGITIEADGGNGGNQILQIGAFGPSPEVQGPGGGGGGGYISCTSAGATMQANGGLYGTTNSSYMSEFPPNGATSGGIGRTLTNFPTYELVIEDDTVCDGQSAALVVTVNGTLPSGGTVTWYDAQFGGSVLGTGLTYNTPNLSTNTTYYVGVCPGSYTIPVTVVVSPPIVIDASGVTVQDENCGNADGEITGITASGGTGTLTYDWNGTITLGPDTVGLAAGSYTLTVTDEAGCTATSGPYTINNSGGPSIDISSIVVTDETCNQADGSITGIVASGSAPLTFEWNGNATSSEDTINISAGSYTLTVTDGLGCSASVGPFTVNNVGAPTIDSSNYVLVDENCGQGNGSVTGIIASGGTGSLTFEWNGNVSADEDLTNTSAGSYTLVVTDANGCSASTGPYVITNIPGPTVDASNVVVQDESCFGNDGSITGIVVSGGTSPLDYDWNGTSTGSADHTGLVGGTYTLTVTDAAGCSQTAGPYTINTQGAPVIDTTSISVADENCGFADGSITGIVVTGGTGAITYDWNGNVTSGADTTGLASGSYTLTVTDAAGCSDVMGPITINGTTPVTASVSPDVTICEGDTAELTASGGSSYTWSSGATTAIDSVTPLTTTTYTVIVSNGVCSDTDTVVVTVNPLPEAIIQGDTILCDGESTELTAGGSGSLEWLGGDTLSTINIQPVSDSTITLIATNGCGTDTTSLIVTVNPPPVVSAGPDQSIVIGQSVVLDGNGATSYSWSPSGTLDCPSCEDPNASPETTTTYIVIGTDANGCVGTDTVVVVVDESAVIFIPDIFSPNDDGNNDVLYVRGGGISQMNFRVYDRWGEMLFESTDMGAGWDGSYKGQDAASGVYVYTVTGEFYSGESIDLKGSVTLIR